jgi:NAD(P)-dependent dehydrogenase (short-subunit alcohol dehydrogenase family)
MTNTKNTRQRRVALITDTAQHLGPYLAKELARRNHDLVISDPNVVIEGCESSAPDLVDELRAMNVQVEVVEVDDVNKAGSVQKLVDRAQEVYGGFDSAFIRPGVHILANFQSATLEKFQGSVEGNMLSVMYALQAMLPPLMEQGSGQVLIEISATGSKDWPGSGFLYGATRAGAKYMVNNAALEAAKCGVSVNGMGTMFLDYPGFRNSTNVEDPQVAAEIKKLIPEGRFGKPEEAAHLAAALLDGKCNYYTAEFVNFCGGWTGV